MHASFYRYSNFLKYDIWKLKKLFKKIIFVVVNNERYLSHGLHRCRDVVDEVFLRHFLTDIAITSQVVFRSIQQLGS